MRRATLTTVAGLAALMIVVALGCGLGLAPPASAAIPFTPGADIYPLFVPNDHTPVAIHFTATGLPDSTDPDNPSPTSYYVKVRFNTEAKPSPTGNRGWIWNADSQQWVQERDDWTKFPVVQRTGTTAAGWLIVKFGDESVSGQYYIIISLTPMPYANSQVLNGVGTADHPSIVTVLDMATNGGWVHDGIATGAAGGALAEADLAAAPTTVLSLGRVEPNLVDDDGDGIVDDEDYGPSGATGDVRLALPLNDETALSLGGSRWPSNEDITLTTADADVALGADDETPPTAVSGATATAGDTEVTLAWSAASDPDDAAGGLHYDIYRWTDPALIGGVTSYSAVPVRVATTGATTWTDAGRTNGVTYHYLVRAVDPATNVGPRSAVLDATPALPTGLTCTTGTPIVGYAGSATLLGAMTVGTDPLSGEQVVVERSADGLSGWTTVTTIAPEAAPAPGNTYRVTVVPPGHVATWFRLRYAARDVYGPTTSPAVSVTPRASVGTPVTPSTVKVRHSFLVYGTLKPHKKKGLKSVTISCFRQVAGAWRFKKTVKAVNVDSGSSTRYRASVSLPLRGHWRLRAAFAGDKLNAAAASGYRRLTVS